MFRKGGGLLNAYLDANKMRGYVGKSELALFDAERFSIGIDVIQSLMQRWKKRVNGAEASVLIFSLCCAIFFSCLSAK